MNFAKMAPPAIVNTYGAGKTVLGETVLDVMANNNRVYAECKEQLVAAGALAILDDLRAHPPVYVPVCFGAGTTQEALFGAIKRLNGAAVPLAGVDESSTLKKLVEVLADLASDHGRSSVYIHFDEVSEVTGNDADDLRLALLNLAQQWATTKPASASGSDGASTAPTVRRLLFLFIGKGLQPAFNNNSSSSGAFSYLHMSALTKRSICDLQDRFCELNPVLASVSS